MNAGQWSASDANREWLELATAVVRALAKTGRPFSVDDIRELIEPPPTVWLLGSPLEWAADRGEIAAIGEVKSNRGPWVTEWIGAEFAPKTKKKVA